MLDTVTLRRPDGAPYYIWRICTRTRQSWQISDTRVAAMDAEQRQTDAERLLGDPGLSRIAHLQLDRFYPERLRVQLGAANPYDAVTTWLDKIRELPTGDYHRGPPPALHLYYPGKGTGKTHLASGAALRARGWGKLAAFIEHTSYLTRSWSAKFEDKERMVALPGDLAWLTVIDDLGQHAPGRDPSSEQKIWYDLINRRWLRRGWSIITSNKTLDELATQGTLTEATYSRLMQMTRGEVVLVEGDDQRLRGR